jgi:hypothetical protein
MLEILLPGRSGLPGALAVPRQSDCDAVLPVLVTGLEGLWQWGLELIGNRQALRSCLGEVLLYRFWLILVLLSSDRT